MRYLAVNRPMFVRDITRQSESYKMHLILFQERVQHKIKENQTKKNRLSNDECTKSQKF